MFTTSRLSPGRGMPHAYQRLGMRIRKRLEQDTLHHAEYSNVGAHTNEKVMSRDER